MQTQTIFGIIEFSTAINCSAEVLGQSVEVTIGDINGILTLPSLPEWEEQEKDPLRKPLLGPVKARTWKRGEDLIIWGRTYSYPNGDAIVERALLEFSLQNDLIESSAQKVYEGFDSWLDLFEKYVILLTTQNTRCRISSNDGSGRIELIIEEETVLKHISKSQSQIIEVLLSGQKETLETSQYREAARLSSQLLPPRFEYMLLLEAYRARKNNDYRKAIIEAANALEICLTARIMDEFDTQNISFGENLLQKFRMLGGRFELIKLLGVPLPDKDYDKLVNKPRNDVVHRGAFPDRTLANQVVTEVESLLHLFSPQLNQDIQ